MFEKYLEEFSIKKEDTMDNNKFQCSYCGIISEKGQSDEDALKEKDILFGDQPCALVCEPCFIMIMDDIEPGQKRYEDFITKK